MVTAPRSSQLGYYDDSQSPSRVPTGIPVPRNSTELFLFLAPFLQFLSINLVGTLFVTDVLLLLVFPFALLAGIGRLRQRHIWIPLLLGILWLFSQVVSDVAVGSPASNYLRGWSKILLTLTHLTTLWLLIRESFRRYLLYGFGWALGLIIGTLFLPSDYARDQPWKFGLAVPVTFLALVLSSLLAKKGRRWLFPVTMVSMALIDLFSSARSLGLICMVAGTYSYIQLRIYAAGKRPGAVKIVGLSLVMALVIFGFVRFYEYSAQSGLLGEKGMEKYSAQSNNSGGIILGGRHEALASTQAIIDSPFIGHGSWAQDVKYHDLLIQNMLESGFKVTGGDRHGSDNLIPEHSFLLGAWVEAGFAGALFWLYIFYQIFRALRRATGGEPFLPVFAFIGLLMMWDILFSPYGADRRFVVTYFFIGIVMFGNMTDKLSQRRLAG